MSDYWTGITKLADVFFNGRKSEDAPAKKLTVTLEALIERRISTVRVGGKVYRVTVEEVK